MNETSSTTKLDRSVKATGDDAMVAKLATTKAGYYVDPFLEAFCGSSDDDSKKKPMGKPRPTGMSKVGLGITKTGTIPIGSNRRKTVQPIIKRGTHARVCVVDRAISGFLKMKHDLPDDEALQIVVLGAGKDTSYFRYRNGNLMGMGLEEPEDGIKVEGFKRTQQRQHRMPRHQQVDTTSLRKVHWYEVDHSSVIQDKASLIRKSKLLKSFCPLLVKSDSGYECTGASTSLGSFSAELGSSSSSSSSTYHLIGHDLRDSPTILLEKLNLNPTIPTLFITECVSMYLPITESKNLLQALSVSTDTAFIACFEPILGDKSSKRVDPYGPVKRADPFGHVMERNLINKGVASPESCLLQTRTLKDQLEKLIECEGFRRAVGCDMWSAYETIVTAAQRQRANKSEFMDEYEEWILIMRHYCFVVAQGGRSPHQEAQPDLTTVQGPNEKNTETSSLMGWVSGKCLELEKSSE